MADRGLRNSDCSNQGTKCEIGFYLTPKYRLDRGVPVDSVRFESVCYSGDSELIQLFLDRGSVNIALFLQCRVVNDFSSRADYHNGLTTFGQVSRWRTASLKASTRACATNA